MRLWIPTPIGYASTLALRPALWSGNRRVGDPSLLLRGADLRKVIQTLEDRGDWTPDPTPLQEEYVSASRKLGARELAQRKARELATLAGVEQEAGNDEVAALLARHAFLLLDRHDVSDRTHVDKALREIIAKPFFSRALRASEGQTDWIATFGTRPTAAFSPSVTRAASRTAARGTRMNSSTEPYVLPCATAPGPGTPSCW